MAWPSGTKASTTNIDAGSDKPALARADIKQNIDNVNSIIDTFDIASPSNGDILVYNSTSGAWEPGAPASTGTNIATVFRSSTATAEENVSANIYRLRYTLTDPNSFITVVDNFQIQLSAGSYYLECFNGQSDTGGITLGIYNETGSVNIVNFGYNEMSNVGEGFRSGKRITTFGSTTNISFRVDNADVNQRNATEFQITITKL